MWNFSFTTVSRESGEPISDWKPKSQIFKAKNPDHRIHWKYPQKHALAKRSVHPLAL